MPIGVNSGTKNVSGRYSKNFLLVAPGKYVYFPKD